MAVTANFYGQFFTSVLNKEVDFAADTIMGALLTSSYTPDLGTHNYYDDLTSEVSAAGTGYTTGGQSLGTCTVTYTAANSWGTARADSTAYDLGAVVRPAAGNGYLYQASTAGTSTSGAPTYPTNVGGTVTDGTVVWTCVGTGVVVLDDDGTNLSWDPSTITARYLAVYDATPGTAATNPLIALVDFGEDVVSSSGPFDVTFSSLGVAAIFV